MSSDAQSHEIRTDIRGLIRLLAKNLYAKPDVFLREMIQNAHDAVVRRGEIEGERAPAGTIRLHIVAAPGDYRLIIEDNGAGLTETEIHDYLSTIGRSGTDAFRQELLNKGRYAEASNLIGQFGIGLLSAFVVADRVVVETRSCRPDNPGWRWECRGDKNYTLVPSQTLTAPGSRITLFIDSLHRDMLDPAFIRTAVRRYADFINIPILLNDQGRLNRGDAPWHGRYATEGERESEYFAFIAHRFPDRPQEIIPVDLEAPYAVKGVLYISNRRPNELGGAGKIDVYQARMFVVAEHSDLLPPWARFINGVIDCPAFTPTAARDNIQQDSVFRAVREVLGRCIIAHLQALAAENPARFQQLMDWHHYEIKGMALESDEFFQEVADLLPFETNEGIMSLRRYLEQTVQDEAGRRTLLFFSEPGQATQFFMLANARGIRVINAGYVHETRFLEKYAQLHPEILLEQLDFTSSASIFRPLPPDEMADFRELLAEFARAVPDSGIAVRIARFTPTQIPAVVTLSESQKLRRQLNSLKDNPALPDAVRAVVGQAARERPQSGLIAYLNAGNPTIQMLARMDLRSEVAGSAMTAIFNNALLLAQQTVTPEDAEKMVGQFNQVINLLIKRTRETETLRRQIGSPRPAPQTPAAAAPTAAPVSCYLALDRFSRKALCEGLREVLEDYPYGWEVVLRDDSDDPGERFAGPPERLLRAHGFIADLSDLSPDVFMELGMILTFGRPFLLLCSREAESIVREHWPGLDRSRYQVYSYGESPEEFREQLGEILSRQPDFQALIRAGRTRRLSPRLLHGAEVQPAVVEAVCREYATVEEFLAADPDAAAQRAATRRFIILALQEHLREMGA